MSVDDHGLEVLKKSGAQVSGSASNYALQTYSLNQLITASFDYIAVTYPDDYTETYTYKSGGSTGTTVGAITVVYDDIEKTTLMSVAKT